MDANPENVGKYYRWKNGFRVKIVGIDEHKWYRVCSPNNESRTWITSPLNIEDAEEITESEAKVEFVEIKHNTPQIPFCTCGMWRVGKPNISINMALKQGSLASDESYRIQEELEKFFRNLNIITRVSSTDDGMRFEFFDVSVGQKESDDKDVQK
jgi:hypothetical protein